MIAPLLHISYVLGILPIPSSKFGRIYSSCLAVIAIVGYGYFVDGILSDPAFNAIYPTIHVSDFITTALMTLSSLSLTVGAISRRERINGLVENLRIYANDVFNKHQVAKLWWGLLVMIGMAGLVVTVEYYMYSVNFGYKIYRYYIPRAVCFYQASVFLFLMLCMVKIMTKKFRFLNRLIGKSCVVENKCTNMVWYVYDKDGDMKRLRRCYEDLANTVEEFSQIFGVPLLLFVAYCIGDLVHSVHFVVVYSFIEPTENDNSISIACITWIFLTWTYAGFLAVFCNNLARQGQRTLKICCSILNDLPAIPSAEKDKLLKEELLLMTHQVSLRKPVVTAAGFFEINVSMMAMIISSATSFIIVTVEFISYKSGK